MDSPSHLRYFSGLWFLSLIILTPVIALATKPISPPFDKVWLTPLGGLTYRNATNLTLSHPRRDLDDYIGKFTLLCDFLTTMQERDPESDDFGGEHEGEGDELWGIIESDNTQEAIRVWCEYALYFDDSDTYEDYVNAAWEYLNNHPAWEEGPDLFYALHNDGWGIIAEMGYREAYGDDHQDYGRRCAEDIIDATPDITPDMADILMPLVAGWAAGTLYLYGVYEDNADYKNAAVDIAEQVKEWINADSNRLNNNEYWALCGGTAMWGVLNSLGFSDSTTTADWAAEKLENMDVFAGRAGWDNSWNIWYAHAWIAAWSLIGNEDYLNNAITIVDSLLAQDGDGDGGIPATDGDPDDRDQSWVTAYTGWMGLTNLIIILPEFNVAVKALTAPSTDRPWPIGEPLTFSFELQNISYSESYDFPFRLRGDIELDTIMMLEGWGVQSLDLIDLWSPADTGLWEFTAYANHPEDGDRSDDTLRFSLEISSVGEVILESLTEAGEPVSCRFDFYNLEIDTGQVFFSITTSQDSSRVTEHLMVGIYRVAAIPAFPYPKQIYQEVAVTADEPMELISRFRTPPVLLVNNDLDTAYNVYYEEALNAADVNYYRWDSEQLGDISGRTSYFNTVVYFTGDRHLNTLPGNAREELANHIGHGGNLFITGQNIADDLRDEPAFEELLHARHLTDYIHRSLVDGVQGDELMDGMSLLLIGNRGANNQRSPAGVAATNDGIACATYHNAPDTAAAIRWTTEDGGRGVFFAFGFEGISGMGETTSRETVMRSVLDWLGAYSTVPAVDKRYQPAVAQLIAYPNPANGAVVIKTSLGQARLNGLAIYDANGRVIQCWRGDESLGTILWDGSNQTGAMVPSGIYFIQPELVGGKAIPPTRLVFLR